MKKALSISLLALGAILVSTSGIALAAVPNNGLAHNKPILENRGIGFQNMLERKADIIGITSDELKTELKAGKNFLNIAEEHGLTPEKFHEELKNRAKEYLEDLVKEGTITQAQADQKLERMENRAMNCTANSFLGGHRKTGFGKGMIRGFRTERQIK